MMNQHHLLAYSQLGYVRVPEPRNEPMRTYAPHSPERAKLMAAIQELKNSLPVSVPAVIDGIEIHESSDSGVAAGVQINPSCHSQVVAKFPLVSKRQTEQAIDGAMRARAHWESMPFVDRAAIFLRAADLLTSDKYRYRVMAATMIGQGKNIWQAEIDAACELADFWRFNAHYADEMYRGQPRCHAAGTWNTTEYRALEGFVLAVSPFNFTAIGGNLVSAPAMLGNVVVWKPSAKAVLSNYLVYTVLRDAGLPPGVIQFVPAQDTMLVPHAMSHRGFAALHFTGSTAVFRSLWKLAASNLEVYAGGYPRLVGETGGKNMHFVHVSAIRGNAGDREHDDDVRHVVASTLRAAFEYSGQKCSACSRLYVPASLWTPGGSLREQLLRGAQQLLVGDACEAPTFVGPVIDEGAFDRVAAFIERHRAKVVAGGRADKSRGFFISPTVIDVGADFDHEGLRSELFGPVLVVCVYDDADYEGALQRASQTSEYALTCAVFARDRGAIALARERLRHAAGNFYINDKCTGAVVGQQAFGGARASGTNDKAGAGVNLLRWVSMRTIKESFGAIGEAEYPSNQQ